jgi:hypothetical protein
MIARDRLVVETVDIPNANGRVYPRSVLENAVKEYNKKQHRFVYSCWIPDDRMIHPHPLSRVAAKITNLRLIEDDLIVEFEFLKTPDGKTLQAAREEGLTLTAKLAGTGKCLNITDSHIIYDYVLEGIFLEPVVASSALAPPRVVCAANWLKSGLIVTGARHHDKVMNAQIKAAGDTHIGETQGFIDQFGDFLTREEALDIAQRNGQIRRRCGGDTRELFSENLY